MRGRSNMNAYQGGEHFGKNNSNQTSLRQFDLWKFISFRQQWKLM